MAANFGSTRYSLRYTSEGDVEKLSRTIGGLNVGYSTPSDPPIGPHGIVAVRFMIGTLEGFTTGSVSNVRWVSEQEVIL